MFEKCGLRDVFVRIWKMKWLILVLVIIGAAVGSLMYVRNVRAYQAELADESTYYHTMYTGHAYYYINVTGVSGNDTYGKRQSAVADAYKKLAALPSTSKLVYRKLLKNHSAEELGALLDKERYAENSVAKYKLYGRSYGIRTISNKAVLELRVCAETKEVCNELLKICMARLAEMDEGMLNSTIVLENRYIKKARVGANFFNGIYVVKSSTSSSSSSTSDETVVADEPEEKEASVPGTRPIILWAFVGLLAGIILAIGAAVFAPTINRDSDFEGYEVPSLGTVRKDGAAMLARILRKKADERKTDRVTLVTTLKPDKRIVRFTDGLQKAAEALELEIVLVGQPAKKAEAADAFGTSDLIIALERKGITRHLRFDEMKHYLGILEKSPDAAVLLA